MEADLGAIRRTLPRLEKPREEGDLAPQVRSWNVLSGRPLEVLEAGKRYVISFPGHMSADNNPADVLKHLNMLAAKFKDEDLEVVVVLWNTADNAIFKETYLENHRLYMAAAGSSSHRQDIRIVSENKELERAWFPPKSLADADTFVVDAGRIAWTGRLGDLGEAILRTVLNGDYARSKATEKLEKAIGAGRLDEADRLLAELLALSDNRDARRTTRESYGRKIAAARQALDEEERQEAMGAKIQQLQSLFESKMKELQAAEQAGDIDKMSSVAAEYRNAIPSDISWALAPFAYLLEWQVATRKGNVVAADRLTEELLDGDTRALGFRQLLLISQLNTRAPGRPPNFRLAAQAAEMAIKAHSADFLPSGESGEDGDYRMCLRLLANARAGEGKWEEAGRVTQELLLAAKKWEPASVASIEAFLLKCQSEKAGSDKPR